MGIKCDINVDEWSCIADMTYKSDHAQRKISRKHNCNAEWNFIAMFPKYNFHVEHKLAFKI